MTDEATQEQGVSDSRLQMLNEINKRRVEEMADDLEHNPEAAFEERTKGLRDELEEHYEPENEEVEDEEAEDPEKEPEEAPEEAAPESPVYLKDGEWVTRLKINGIEQEVPFQKVQANAQKNEAADLRLQEASQRQKQLEEYERYLRQQEQLLKQNQPSSAKDVDDQTVKNLIKQQREALLDGDDDRYDEITSELLRVGRQSATQNYDPRQFETIAQRTALQTFQQMEQQRRINEADAYFAREFSDIQNDEALMNVASRYVDQIRQANPTINPLDLVKEAGKQTRNWLASKTGATQKQQTIDQKRKLSAVKGASAKTPPKPKPKPQTREDYIADLARKRASI